MFDLNSLPTSSEKRIAIRVKPAAERAIKSGHPWIYEDAIQEQSHDGKSGDLAIIYDKKKNRFLAVGLYDPNSPIRIKILQSGDPATINQAWFESKLEDAQAIRAPLVDSRTTGYRLVYGESDHFPGLILDRYAETLVMKIYTPAWIPHLRALIFALQSTLEFERLVLRLSRSLQDNPYALSDGQVLMGDPIFEPIQFRENGLNFYADVVHGHKTGFFFDQRDNRQLVRELAQGKSVLDVFSYVGAFAVYALAGGAQSVTALDISEPAMSALRDNLRLNHLDEARTISLVADAFEGMAKLAKQGKQFDMLIVDPPSFAKSQAEIERALLSYTRLVKLALPLVKPDGIFVMASCSSRIKPDVFFNLIFNTANQDGYHLTEMARTSHAIDHPIAFPEAEYLKCLFARVDV